MLLESPTRSTRPVAAWCPWSRATATASVATGWPQLAADFCDTVAVGTVHELDGLPGQLTAVVLTPTLSPPEAPCVGLVGARADRRQSGSHRCAGNLGGPGNREARQSDAPLRGRHARWSSSPNAQDFTSSVSAFTRRSRGPPKNTPQRSPTGLPTSTPRFPSG